ncbi:hypothetical protein HZA56_12925 [Candidatus Poribacteria bacterium]|nr:hypothetical protein [Candidatus Poribacteria bacterium]
MERYVCFGLLGYRWTARTEFAHAIKERVIPLALSGETSPEVRVIKHKLLRDSFIISSRDSSPDMFVKVHKYERPAERLKTLFRASKAKAEWRMSGQMFDTGLPVAEPLAFGERSSGGVVTGCALIQRALPECDTLSGYIVKELSRLTNKESVLVSEAIDAFLGSLGRLIRQMHSAGFWHPDLHTGNILVETGTAPPKLWLVDLHSAGHASDLSSRRRIADLAKMIFSLDGFLDQSQLRKVLTGYCPEASAAKIGEMLARLLVAAASLRRRRQKSRAMRCLKTSGRFVVEERMNSRIYRRRDVDEAMILDAINCHRQITASKGPGFIKETKKSMLTAFSLPRGAGESIYVKQFANRGIIRFLENTFYIHRGRRAWKASHLLRILDVPCAEPIALVEERKLGLLHTSYLLMKEISDAARLDVFLQRSYFRISGRLAHQEILRKRSFVRAGAHALREFHAKRIYQKDLSPKNVLVRNDGDGKVRFYCVDSDSVEFPWRVSFRRRIKNLAQLNGLPTCITTTDRLRFYKEYFGVQNITLRHRLFLSIIRLISGRRVAISRRIDEALRGPDPEESEAYEDITSLQ